MIAQEIGVLDHGYVRFIASMGEDSTIIEAARMSTGKGFLGWGPLCSKCGRPFGDASVNKDRSKMVCFYCPEPTEPKPGDEKLLTFLYENKHMTPFEMCELHLEVRAPIMVFREWHRHRTMSYNEMSGRYTQLPELFYRPEQDRIVKQSNKNKQGGDEPLNSAKAAQFVARTAFQQHTYYDNYEAALNEGIAREIARVNCPISQYSTMRVKTDLRNWLAFLALRMPESAQWEIRQYAHAVASIIKDLWPRTYALFEEHTLHAVTFSATEAKSLRCVLGGGYLETPFFEALLKKLGLPSCSANK